MTIIFKSGIAGTGLTDLLPRDPALIEANGGVKFLFDLGWDYGYPRQAAPIDGTLIRDISDNDDGDVDIIAGQSVAYAGGGFDFTGLTEDPAVVRGPAGCLSSIYAGAQYFMVVGYSELPTSGDWNTDATLAPIFCTSSHASGYPSGPDMVTVAQGNGPSFTARRQYAAASAVQRNITVASGNLDNYRGQFTQWAAWRNASGFFLRAKSALGVHTTTAETSQGSNTQNFGGQQPQWGVPLSFNALATKPGHVAAAKHRLYRGWVEDLEISGRDPATILDADWAFVQAQGAFS